MKKVCSKCKNHGFYDDGIEQGCYCLNDKGDIYGYHTDICLFEIDEECPYFE